MRKAWLGKMREDWMRYISVLLALILSGSTLWFAVSFTSLVLNFAAHHDMPNGIAVLDGLFALLPLVLVVRHKKNRNDGHRSD
jgi:hypothetical protein